MEDKDDIDETPKRKTISLKTGAGISAPRIPSGSKTIEVEIKRKKSGLTVDIDLQQKQQAFDDKGVEHVQTGKLTDSEFKTRVRALQEALKDEEQYVEASDYDEVQENNPLNTVDEELPDSNSVTVSDIEKKPETWTKRPRRMEPKKKEHISFNSKPVVFRTSDYTQKPAAKPLQGVTTQQKTETSLVSQDSQVNNTRGQYRTRDKDFDESSGPKKKVKLVVKSRSTDRKMQPGKKISRVFLDRAMNSDYEDRFRSIASIRRARQKQKGVGDQQDAVKVIREVSIPDVISVGELANRMAVRSGEVIKYLLSIGTIANVNQLVDGDTAEVICTEFGHIPKRISESDIESDIMDVEDTPNAVLTLRAPIVTVMGHVDHGKTTLLDSLRKTGVAQKEAGGITQHVAAYQIKTKDGKKITFIDTPGHAAFANIRARGAVITDIIILVVTADDGVKDQTIEVISQAKSQNVPIIVAINKIDRPNINISKVKAELMAQEVILEDFGGNVLGVEISAKTGLNLDKLIDAVLLQSEMLELKANKDRKAIGVVLESRIDKGRGIIASVIVQNGVMKDGDVFVAGSVFGKVRTIYDDTGKRIKSASPSTPIEIVGFDSTPKPGDILTVVDSEQKAREIAEYRKGINKTKEAKTIIKTMDQMIARENSSMQTLDVLVKADVYGSLEAIVGSLESISHPDINVKVIEKGIGIISENDVEFAKTANSTIIGFNVNVSSSAKDLAKVNSIKIMHHNVIYHMIEEVKAIMGKMLSPIVEESYIGTADVRKIFFISRIGTIAGCYVSDGIIKKSDAKIKVMRNDKCVFTGKIRSMKHEKDEIKESRKSYECGILTDGFNDFKEGDQIECYEIILKSRSVD